MPIVNTLEQIVDVRKGGTNCDFNGYLEDYIDMMDDTSVQPIFNEIFKENPNARVLVNLRVSINKNAITNQIIRYKDAFKLEGNPLVIPYIIYESKDQVERAMLFYPHGEGSYIYNKGLYYCMTEPGSLFIENRNELLAVSLEDPKEVCEAYTNMFKFKPGSVQRKIDAKQFSSYDKLKEMGLELSNKLKTTAFDTVNAATDKQPVVYDFVIKWFLLKKVLYVQYMLNKDFLTKVHEGNVKKQRNQAKLNADEIMFLSYSSLWRGKE